MPLKTYCRRVNRYSFYDRNLFDFVRMSANVITENSTARDKREQIAQMLQKDIITNNILK